MSIFLLKIIKNMLITKKDIKNNLFFNRNEKSYMNVVLNMQLKKVNLNICGSNGNYL